MPVRKGLRYIHFPMIFRFAEFTLDTGTGSLTGPDGPIALRRQTYRLLEVLLRHAPDLVDRDTLLDEAWGRTALSANVLPQAISELRQALGDSPQAPRHVETLHRRGYRIIPEVQMLDGQARNSRPQGDTTAESGRAGSARTASRLPVLGLIAIAALFAVTAVILWLQDSERRWLERSVLPQARSLIESDVVAAWRLVREARKKIDDAPQLEQLWLDLTLPVDLSSEPSGAKVAVIPSSVAPARRVCMSSSVRPGLVHET